MNERITRKWRFPGVVVALTFVIACATAPPDGDSDAPDVRWLCDNHPEIVTHLFAGIDLDRPGLEQVKLAVEDEDWPAACTAVVLYYKTSESGQWVRRTPQPPPPTDSKISRGKGNSSVAAATDSLSEQILSDTFNNYSVEAKVPRTDTGGLDWTYNGPEGDREWGWSLNRHYSLKTLLQGYSKTGNVAYVLRLDNMVRDWVLASPYPGEQTNTAQWRGLEASARVLQWIDVFYGLQDVEEFSPTARIMMLSSILDHAHYLRNFHARRGNWVANEMKGLAVIAVSWPEFAEAPEWLQYASDRIMSEISAQVYPDGAQKELTSTYHFVAMKHFREFIDVLNHGGVLVEPELPDGIERMWDYLAYTIRPNGHGPLNNDSDYLRLGRHVEKAARKFGRDDWTYIISGGAVGTKPQNASVVFPWAGQAVMRNGWDRNAHWAFFDVGPWGMAHQHNDKLHLSVTAFGRDLLVDAGRYNYVAGAMRDYIAGSRAHNVILIDERGQMPGAKETAAPIPNDSYVIAPAFDYARGSFEDGYEDVVGEVVHTRAVLYVRDRFWVVVDRIETDRPRQIDALWHFHPDCNVVTDQNAVLSNDEGAGNLSITPVDGRDWRISVVRGQDAPRVQGWYSPNYDIREPAPTAIFSGRIDQTETVAWILLPARGRAEPVEASFESVDDDGVRVRVVSADQGIVVVTVPLRAGAPDVSRQSPESK